MDALMLICKRNCSSCSKKTIVLPEDTSFFMNDEKKRAYYVVLCCFVLTLFQLSFCEIQLPRLISDGMVLQRDAEVKIWGWADEGEQVKVDFNSKIYKTTADADGRWAIHLCQQNAGGPYTMNIYAENHIALENILIGDVWVCSGQSNMELSMDRVSDRYLDVITNANNSAIRQFMVPRRYDFNKSHEDLTDGHWESVTAQSIHGFTATGYFFASFLFEKYGVPIGLINAALGGSPAEAWLSEDALKVFPEHLKTAIQYKDDAYVENVQKQDQTRQDAWNARLEKMGIRPDMFAVQD